MELRPHTEFVIIAIETEEKLTEKRNANIQGVKNFSCLLKVISSPRINCAELYCLGHVQSVIKRWHQLLSTENVKKMDSTLTMALFPENVHVTYNESVLAVGSWKAKHGRLFVLSLGVPIGTLWSIFVLLILVVVYFDEIQPLPFDCGFL